LLHLAIFAVDCCI